MNAVLIRKLLIAAFAAGAIYMQWQGWRIDRIHAQQSEELARIALQNASAEEENAQLRARLDDLKDNPQAIFEELARERLYRVKPGEIYVLPQSETT